MLMMATTVACAQSTVTVTVTLRPGQPCGGHIACVDPTTRTTFLCRPNVTMPWPDARCPPGQACVRNGTVMRCFARGPAAPPPPKVSSLGPVESMFLSAHNGHRALHRVPALTWNDTVARSAAAWAAGCRFAHESQATFGENLFGMWGGTAASSNVDMARRAVDAWYAEERDYDYARPGFSGRTGHFTAVVWRATRALGCTVQSCSRQGMTLVVCRYWPPGNVIGQFPQNVVAPLG